MKGKNTGFFGGRAFGAVCGVLAAVCYGANPLGAVELYGRGYSTGSVLLYRFVFAAAVLAGVIAVRRVPFWPRHRGEWGVVASLGLLFAASSLSFYESFRLMDVSIACTLLFVYPILTALIMCAFFRERFAVSTGAAIALALAGIACLSLGGGEHRVTAAGLALIALSALTYAVYIVVVNRTRPRLHVSTMTFWILAFCALGVAVWTVAADGVRSFRLPTGGAAWFYALFLAVVPTLLSLVFMTYSSRLLGATPTAILGALEPLTAVAIGVFAFGEAFTARLATGLLLVLAAVVSVLVAKARHGRPTETGSRVMCHDRCGNEIDAATKCGDSCRKERKGRKGFVDFAWKSRTSA